MYHINIHYIGVAYEYLILLYVCGSFLSHEGTERNHPFESFHHKPWDSISVCA